MPYREKFAWLQLVSMVVTYGPYFVFASQAPLYTTPAPNLRLLVLFAVVSIARMMILAVGYLWFRLRTPEDVREPADERDRAISQRSTTIAYYVLMAGTLLAGAVMPTKFGGWTIVNAALAAVVLAEIVSYAVAVSSYRRSAG